VEPDPERDDGDKTSLAIVAPTILEYQGAVPIQPIEIAKIHRVVGEVPQPLFLIPRIHVFS